MTDYFRNGSTGKELAGVSAWGQQVTVEDARARYCYASFANTPAATPTDIFTLRGSASKIVRVHRIVIGGIAGTAGFLKIALLRRTAANTAGTSSAVTFLKHDTDDGAATAVGTLYTANASALGAGSILHAGRVFLPLVSATGSKPLVFGPEHWGDQGLVLRGTSEWLAINGQGDTVPASGVLDIDITFTEE